MIDVLTRVSGLFGGIDSQPQPISEWDDEQKWELAHQATYRCAACETPEFRTTLYLVEPERDEHDSSDGSPVPHCEGCLAAADRSEEATEGRELPAPPLGQRGYLIAPDRTERLRRENGEVDVIDVEETEGANTEDDKYAGEYVRRMFESKAVNPNDSLWLGYTKRAGRFRELGVEFEELFEHLFISGTTGAGKSNLAHYIMQQFAAAWHGFCCLDPHGDLVKDLLETLPPQRRDDVVWVEPAPGADVERITGMNFLEVEAQPGDNHFTRAVDAAIDDVVGVLKRDTGWGDLMGPVAENLIRAMILMNAECERTEDKYTFVDFRAILLSQERRQEFADEVEGAGYEFIGEYTQKIAQIDEQYLDALIRRLNKWIESQITREIVAHKESSISIGEIVAQNKILLVNNDVDNEDIQRMIAIAITRRIWRTVKKQPKGERTPFFLLIDEVDDILTEEMQLDDMLGNARKYKLGLVLMTQYIEKLDDPTVEKAVGKLCNTTITFRNPDYDPGTETTSQIERLRNYKALVNLRINGQPQGPFEIKAFAPVPAIRTTEEAEEWLKKPSLERDGVPRLSDEEIRYQSIDEHTLGVDENTTISSDESTATEDPFTLTDERLAAICQSVLDESIDRGRDDNAVRWDEALVERIKVHHDAGERITYASHEGALFDSLPVAAKDDEDPDEPLRCWEDETGDMWLQVTSRGRSKIFETGTTASSGGPKHRKLLQDCYRPFTSIGGQVQLPEQTGESMPDGSLSIDWQTLAEEQAVEETDGAWESLSAEDRDGLKAVLRENLSEDHPLLAWLTDGRETAIEAESTTGDSKGGQTSRNVAEAINAAQRCLLLCREHNAEKVWKTLTSPPYLSEYSDLKNGEERLYNLGDHSVAGQKMLRPAGNGDTVWIHDLDTDEYVLRDSKGKEHHRFANAQAVFQDAGAYPYSVVDDPDETTEIPDGWTTVKRPFVPEYDFDGGIPDRDAWEIIIVESGATDPSDLSVYRAGKTKPLPEVLDWNPDAPSREDAINALDSALK